LPLSDGRIRRDVTFVTSGLFRDLYGHLLTLLDRAVLLALDGASQSIEHDHPELREALGAALAPLGPLRAPGAESHDDNQHARPRGEQTRAALAAGSPAAVAGRGASHRVFGNAPGGYGAGINRLAERSGSWTDRGQLAAAYEHRMGHAYGDGLDGAPAHDAFRAALARTENTYLGRASNLYGLLDNNDGFDYLGGLGMAVEAARGKPPVGRVALHADRDKARLETLPEALFAELRGRHLNPVYLRALMEHGYAGARTMGSEFLENLWGWQVTSPEVVEPWVWDETRAVFLEDAHGIGLDEFLARDDNAHVRSNILALHLVAAQKGFWSPDEAALRELAGDFVRQIAEHGLPGSGHTRPDHPVMAFALGLAPDDAPREKLERVLAAARRSLTRAADPSVVAEIELTEAAPGGFPWLWLALGALGSGLFALGVWRGVGPTSPRAREHAPEGGSPDA
jgi:cobaltochelatase CobN